MPVFEPAFDIEYDIGSYPPAFEDLSIIIRSSMHLVFSDEMITFSGFALSFEV